MACACQRQPRRAARPQAANSASHRAPRLVALILTVWIHASMRHRHRLKQSAQSSPQKHCKLWHPRLGTGLCAARCETQGQTPVPLQRAYYHGSPRLACQESWHAHDDIAGVMVRGDSDVGAWDEGQITFSNTPHQLLERKQYKKRIVFRVHCTACFNLRFCIVC